MEVSKEEIYTSRFVNDFHTTELTELGRDLYNKAIVTKDTMLLDVRETIYKEHKIVFQTIDRAMFKINAPTTYDVTITKLEQKPDPIKREQPSNTGMSWWSRFFKK